MGHDAHFLERLDRVAHDHVEFALGLYRDHEAVRFLLDKLEGKGDRIALAIGDEQRGPFVVVARDGGFVTCLGEGMSTGDLYVAPRGRVDAILAKYRDQKDRDSARELERRPKETNYEFLRRTLGRADALTREEFVALSSLSPIVHDAFYEISLTACDTVIRNLTLLRGRTTLRGPDLEIARKIERNRWLAGHATLLAAIGERDYFERVAARVERSPFMLASQLASTTLALRGAWAAGRVGKTLLPHLRKRAAATVDYTDVLEIALGLAAIGLRHKNLRGDCERALGVLAKKTGDSLDETRHDFATRAAASFAAGAEDVAVERGREMFFRFTEHLADDDPYRFATPRDVPADIARTALLTDDDGYMYLEGIDDLFMALPLLASARAEDFYHPREIIRRTIVESTPEQLTEIVRRFDYVFAMTPQTVRAGDRPARNDPCPCGSGKKWKKCCAR